MIGGRQPEKSFFLFFFEILSDLNQAIPNHLADESQTRQPDTLSDHTQDGQVVYPAYVFNSHGPVVYPANAFDSRLRGD